MSGEHDGEAQEWMDRFAVQQLIHRYADSVTRADWDETEAVFAPDAVLEIASPYDIRVVGNREIRQFLADGTRGSELLIQTAQSPVVRLVGRDAARATTTIHEVVLGEVSVTSNFAEAGTRVNYEQYGIYYDDAARIDGEWKFTRRHFQSLYQAPDVVSGSVVAARSTLLRSD